MKSTTLILLLTALLAFTDAPASAYTSYPSADTEAVTAKEESIFRKKRKRPRQKRGFMWGLFKKKDCGCPKF